jgi:DNA-binding CsgD family transcriptional regulator
MPAGRSADSRLSRLVARLYDAALDDGLWPGAADEIAQALGSTSAVVKVHGQAGRVSLVERTGNLVVPARDEAWADDWHRRDLWVARSVAHGMNQVITDEDLVTPEEQESSGFYQEWLPRLEIHHMLGAVFPMADGVTGVLGVHRPRGAGGYTDRERRRFALLLPHLQRSLRLSQRLAEAADRAAAALGALDRLDTGVVVVDEACRVRWASAMGETLLRRNPELGVVQGRLALRDPARQEALVVLVRAAIDTANGRPRNPGAALSAPRRDRTPLALEVAPLSPSAHAFGALEPLALVLIRDPEAPLAVERLRALFDLTPAEGAVAAALGRGRALPAIAADTGVGLATVRSHLKRILSKTGTRRQAEAAALFARSLATAPD